MSRNKNYYGIICKLRHSSVLTAACGIQCILHFYFSARRPDKREKVKKDKDEGNTEISSSQNATGVI